MPIFFQHRINPSSQLAIWKIEEPLSFFESRVGKASAITHEKVAIRHLAGRFLLTQLAPDFPLDQIQVAESGKPYLASNSWQFSISHTGNAAEDFVAAIISNENSVGIDIEFVADRIFKVATKFLSEEEMDELKKHFMVSGVEKEDGWKKALTASWSIKESVYKWQGMVGVDFKDHLKLQPPFTDANLCCAAIKSNKAVTANFQFFNNLCLSWVHH